MELVKINKISVNKKDYFNINGFLDLENLSFQFDLSFEDYFAIFNRPLLFPLPAMNLYLIDENGKNYSCLECLLGYKTNSSVSFKTVSINYIFENYIGEKDNILTDKIIFETSYPKSYHYGCYINKFKIKYTSQKNIYIDKKIDNSNDKTILFFRIESKIKTKREKLDDVLYRVLEIFYLIFGSIPKIEKYIFYVGDDEIILYQKIADKYFQNLKSGSNDSALSVISSEVLTADLIKRFIKFRKDTYILYDVFMTSQNGIGYMEMNNSLLVQLIEGTYITLNNDNKKELWQILEYYFLKDNTIKQILNKKDLKNANDSHNTSIFLLKAKEHRHYLSHFNMNENKKVFEQLENNYAQFKLILCLRIIYMNYLNIKINQEMLNKLVDSINKWGERRKIKI